MLGKLLKYEIKATARLFIPLYLTILIFAAVNRFLLGIHYASDRSFSFFSLVTSISMIVYVTLLIGLVVMTLVVLIQRFYKNLLGDEGYLMFTLPVQSWKHILGKLAVSMFWTIISGIVAFCSIMLISSSNVFTPDLLNRLSAAFNQFILDFGATAYLISFEVIVLGLLTLASTILTIYAAIALGHLFNKYKLLASFGMYIALKTVSQIVMSLSAVIFVNLRIFHPGGDLVSSQLLINGILLIAILYYGAATAIYFVLTNFILKRKLNLE